VPIGTEFSFKKGFVAPKILKHYASHILNTVSSHLTRIFTLVPGDFLFPVVMNLLRCITHLDLITVIIFSFNSSYLNYTEQCLFQSLWLYPIKANPCSYVNELLHLDLERLHKILHLEQLCTIPSTAHGSSCSLACIFFICF